MFVQSLVYVCLCYMQWMVLLFYVKDYQICSLSKDKIDNIYASVQVYSKIEKDCDLNKYLGIE